MTFWEGPGCL